MKKLDKIIGLGSVVKDLPTGLEGTVVHLNLELDGSVLYDFQPKGLNPETHLPLPGLWVVRERLESDPKDEISLPELPYEVLGTQVTDKASGFTGIAVSLCLHINGCVHVNIQPKGVTKFGGPIQVCNFDIRRLEGPAIKALSKTEKKESERRNPSPSESPVRYAPLR